MYIVFVLKWNPSFNKNRAFISLIFFSFHAPLISFLRGKPSFLFISCTLNFLVLSPSTVYYVQFVPSRLSWLVLYLKPGAGQCQTGESLAVVEEAVNSNSSISAWQLVANLKRHLKNTGKHLNYKNLNLRLMKRLRVLCNPLLQSTIYARTDAAALWKCTADSTIVKLARIYLRNEALISRKAMAWRIKTNHLAKSKRLPNLCLFLKPERKLQGEMQMNDSRLDWAWLEANKNSFCECGILISPIMHSCLWLLNLAFLRGQHAGSYTNARTWAMCNIPQLPALLLYWLPFPHNASDLMANLLLHNECLALLSAATHTLHNTLSQLRTFTIYLCMKLVQAAWAS